MTKIFPNELSVQGIPLHCSSVDTASLFLALFISHSYKHMLTFLCSASYCRYCFFTQSGHSNIHIAPAWISLKLPLQIPKSITDANKSLAERQSVFWTPGCHQKSHHHFFTCSCGTQLCLAGSAFAWSVRFAVQR